MVKSRPTGRGLKIMYLTDDRNTLIHVETLLAYNNVDVLSCCDDDMATVLNYGLANISDSDALILDLRWRCYPDEKFIGLTYLYSKLLPAKPQDTLTAVLTRFAGSDELKEILQQYNIPLSLCGDALTDQQRRTVIGNLLQRLGVQVINFPEHKY